MQFGAWQHAEQRYELSSITCLPNAGNIVVYVRYARRSSNIWLVVYPVLLVRAVCGSGLELFAVDLEDQWLGRFLTILSS